MTTKLWGKDLKAYEDIDVEELLSKLSPEEIAELNNDFDPDDSLLPPSQRCRDQTTKEPTGPFDRDRLINYLEERAKSEPDRDERVPFEHVLRGKEWKHKKEDGGAADGEAGKDDVIAEFDDVLKNATEDELCDLAAILGLTGLMNQVQYQASLDNKPLKEAGGFSAVALAAAIKPLPDEPPNTTDIEGSIKKLEANDASLTTLNLNNIRNISKDTFSSLFAALKSNKTLKELHLANTGLTDMAAQGLVDAFGAEGNKTLTLLNVESNFLTSATLVALTKATAEGQAIEQLHLANQAQKVLGVQVESALMEAVEKCDSLLRFGLFLQSPNARLRIQDKLQANLDLHQRQERLSKLGVSPTRAADSKDKPQPLPAPAASNKQALKAVPKS